MAKDKQEKSQKADKSQGKGKKGGESKPAAPAPPPRLRQMFREQVAPSLKSEFAIANPMAAPRIEKVVLSVGMGKSLEGTKLNPKARETVVKDLTVISGQKPVVVKARKSVSNFKVRAGYESGAMVTLRGARMWEFLDRLIATAIPRIKDFRGLNPKSFDGQGNYSFGVTEQGIFPEIDTGNIDFTHGMHVTIVMKNSSPELSRALLRGLGVPFADANAESGRLAG